MIFRSLNWSVDLFDETKLVLFSYVFGEKGVGGGRFTRRSVKVPSETV